MCDERHLREKRRAKILHIWRTGAVKLCLRTTHALLKNEKNDTAAVYKRSLN